MKFASDMPQPVVHQQEKNLIFSLHAPILSRVRLFSGLGGAAPRPAPQKAASGTENHAKL
jgi:hypothetical protein